MLLCAGKAQYRWSRLTSNVRRHKNAPMSPLFKKLNLGSQTEIHVQNAPSSFEPELTLLEGVAVKRSVSGRSQFAMAFVATEVELATASTKLAKACEGDAVLWMVYPKGTSKKYKCEFNRDSGWPLLDAAGFEPVRMVAVDQDWSALRFRRVEHIKTIARNPTGAFSKAGKRKASAQ